MGCGCTREAVTIENKRFLVLSRIADGGFGSIDLIEESNSKKLFALKTIKCESKDEIEKASLENKYYKLLNNHPNSVKLIYDAIIEDLKNQRYLILSVFSYYRNGTLHDEITANLKSNIFIQSNRLVKILKGICNGLKYIHDLNMAHRDLKPHNILLSDDRQTPILTDFGSMTSKVIKIDDSKTCQEIEDWASENCSMSYRAPEFFSPKQGSEISQKADIWSLGCVLYAVMYNKAPFDYVFEKGDSLALAVTNANFTIPKEILREEILIRIVKNTIIFDPEKRQNVEDIIEDLNRIEFSQPNQTEIV